MAFLALAALAASVVFVLGSMTIAGIRGLGAWRSMRALFGSLGTAAEGLAKRVETTADHAGGISDRVARLTEALERLQESRARLAILEAAVGDARPVLTALRFFTR